MDLFWVVTLFHFQLGPKSRSDLEQVAVGEYHAVGIEEFSLSEKEVDALLGERSYSGGDLPEEVLQEVEDKVLSNPGNFRFFFQNKIEAKLFYDFVKNNFLCEVQLEEKEAEDWNAEWKKHYAPIHINEFLDVIPSWETDYSSLATEKIFIYPGMGFGTGSHETTFLCLKIFTEKLLNKNISSVLDFGSGSGILGLSVFKFFQNAQIDFYDIDPEANKNCYVNAEINSLQNHSFRLLLPDYRKKLKPKYDLVFANILEGILIQERDSLISLVGQGGHLILSGLLRHQVEGIINQYSKSELKLELRLDMGDWSALLLERK